MKSFSNYHPIRFALFPGRPVYLFYRRLAVAVKLSRPASLKAIETNR